MSPILLLSIVKEVLILSNCYCSLFLSKSSNSSTFQVVADAYKFDEIDVDSYFFSNFMAIFTKSSRIIRFSKRLEYVTFSIKKFEYEEFFAKESLDLSTELHVSKHELLFILNSVPDILELYTIISETNFVPLKDPKTITSSLQSASYFHYYNDYNVVGVRIRFKIRLPSAYIQKFDSKIEKFSKIDLNFGELEKIFQSLTFL